MTLREWWTRVTTPESVILQEIDEELRFHHDEALKKHLSRGLEPDEAAQAAREELGDLQRLRRRCLREAIGPRRHARAVTLSAGVIALAAAGFAYTHTSGRLARSQETLSRLDARVQELSRSLAAVQGGEMVPLAQTVHFITIDGAVQKPRLWTLPRNAEPTLRQLIQRSGGLRSDASGTIVVSKLRGREVVETLVITPAEWNDPSGPDPVLAGFYHVNVTPEDEPSGSRQGV